MVLVSATALALTAAGRLHIPKPPEPDGPILATVPDVVAEAPEVDRGDDEQEGDGGSPGRWGTPAPRPDTTSIMLEELRGGWRIQGGIEEAAALAVVAGHAWAESTARSGPQGARRTSGVGDEGGASMDTAATGVTGTVVTVEAVERPGALHAVVTLLVAADGALHRLAVPVLLDADGPSLAGPAWTLPAPDAAPRTVIGMPIGDIVLLEAARSALETVGIDGERLVALEATDGWPFIARLDDDTTGHPWLRWHLDRFVVAGLPLDAAGIR